MKITDHIERFKGETQFTFEILPPLKGQNISTLMDVIEVLMDFKPPFTVSYTHLTLPTTPYV